jgi:DNA-binding CsgD family transcriptional regulator
LPIIAIASRPGDDEERIARAEIVALYGGDSVAHATIIERVRRAVEFNGFAFSGLDLDHCRVGRGLYLATNLPEAMSQLYVREQLIAVDPIARRLSEDCPVVRWQDVKDDVDLDDPKAAQLLQLLEFYAVAPRTTFSFWSRGQMYGAATFTRDRPFDEAEIQVLSVLAKAVHGYLAYPVVQAINLRLALTKGELLCLRGAAEGLTSEEIALRVDYTLETVNTYLKSATKKLSAGNRTQAIAQAIRRGIIE